MYNDFKSLDVNNSDQFQNFINLIKNDFDNNFSKENRLQLNRILYDIYVNKINSPLNEGWKDYDHVGYDIIRDCLEKIFENKVLNSISIPNVNIDQFNLWSEEYCQNHPSNVNHKLFNFLKKNASLKQLKKFIYQETPFDIHFGDILAKMLPGVYGTIKGEFSRNFWDEMGHGEALKMHRQLRLDFMEYLNLPLNGYIDNIEDFDVSELELANLYFYTTFNKSKLFIAIGAMLATELMVPGRLDAQIQGWRRIGINDIDMQYLIEHTIVDIEHAEGWIQHVVQPILLSKPYILNDLVKGICFRLNFALNVCDTFSKQFLEESVLETVF